jgi:hypothetical protein
MHGQQWEKSSRAMGQGRQECDSARMDANIHNPEGLWMPHGYAVEMWKVAGNK